MRPHGLDRVLVGTLFGLLAFGIAFWGYHAQTRGGHPIGRVERTRARMNDAVCIFSADVELAGSIGKLEFDRHRLDIREALTEILRRKSSYMVDNPVARTALRHQMVAEVNRIAHRPIAVGLTFSEFELF